MSLSHPETPTHELEETFNKIMTFGFKSGAQSPISTRDMGSGSPLNDAQLEMAQWLMRAEASFKDEYRITDFFDFTIVNDDLEKAYAALKHFCLGVYRDNEQED